MVIITAIVVCYKHDVGQIAKLLHTMLEQQVDTIIIDNNSDADLYDWLIDKGFSEIYYKPLYGNFGIAKAQNIGIAWARELGSDYVVLLDQDSEPAYDMIAKLMGAYEVIAQNYPVAAVGPRYLDPRQDNPPPFIRVTGLHLERCACPTADTVVPVDYLIASGCLIPMATLDRVGGMAEELFIDYVDIEWGLRAKYHGFQSFGVCAAQMAHSLGDNPIHFFGRKIPLHSPLRHYYHFRNAVWCYRQPWLPGNWKLVDGWRLALKYGFYSLFAKPRLAHFVMMTRGLWHGWLGRMGELNSASKSC